MVVDEPAAGAGSGVAEMPPGCAVPLLVGAEPAGTPS
jgi:hypothetical protein